MLYDSVHSKIFSLPDHFTLYPGHDYRGMTYYSKHVCTNNNT